MGRTQAFIDAALTLTSRLDVDGTCAGMLDVVERIFGASSSWILLYEPRSHALNVAATRGPAAEVFADLSIPASGGIAGLAFESAELVFVPDVRQEERWFDADRFHRSGLPSIFTAPLIHDDERIGVIGFHSPRFGPDRLPSDEDRMLLRGLGALASIGIINARLFEKVANERRRRVALSKQQRALRDQLGHLREDARRDSAVNTLIGRSEALLKVLDEIRTVAAADTTVLVLGETGTGKELVARAVHETSARAERPFVPVNCAAMPASLLESELFGHEKGAFTGANERRAGRFEQAHQGTLFLDEIGDLLPDAQAKLLRVLQDGQVWRLGATKPIAVNVRVVAATNRDLGARVEDGSFRADLFYRLSVFPIRLPPLRERREDISLLAEHFLEQHARRQHIAVPALGDDVMAQLEAHEWPGNVRELQNVIERGIILAKEGVIRLDMLPRPLRRKRLPGPPTPSGPRSAPADAPALSDVQRQAILDALTATDWRVAGPDGAAARLGLKPTTLHSKMKKLGIRRPT